MKLQLKLPVPKEAVGWLLAMALVTLIYTEMFGPTMAVGCALHSVQNSVYSLQKQADILETDVDLLDRAKNGDARSALREQCRLHLHRIELQKAVVSKAFENATAKIQCRMVFFRESSYNELAELLNWKMRIVLRTNVLATMVD